MTDQLSNQPHSLEPKIYPLIQEPMLSEDNPVETVENTVTLGNPTVQSEDPTAVDTVDQAAELSDFDYTYGRDLSGSFTEKVKNTSGAVWNTFKTLGREIWTPRERRLKRLGAFTLGLASQGADRGRAPIWFLPPVFTHLMTYSMEHNLSTAATATMSGVAIGGLFGAWTYGVGKTFQVAANTFPDTAEAFEYNQPAFIDSVKRATSGFPTRQELVNAQPEKPEAGYDVTPYQTRKNFIGKAALALARGPKTALLYGTTSQVGIAKVYEHSQESNEKRLRATTIEAAVALGTIAAVVGGLMVSGSVETANNIKDIITNKSVLLKISLGLIAGGWALGSLARHGEAKRRTQAQRAIESIVPEGA